MKKRFLRPLAISVSLLLLLVLIWFKPYKGLYIHMQDASWSEVTVDSSNMPQPVRLRSKSWRSTIKVNSIRHGVYSIHVKYNDGKEFWGTLLHHDAGVRQRLDVYIHRVPGTETIQVTQVANKVDRLFQGEQKASQTSRKKPFQLDWI